MNIVPGDTACLACIFPEPPSGAVETCDTAGILNTAVNFAASIAALEASLKPHGEVRFNKLLLRFTRGEHTLTVFAAGGAVVQGTTAPALARSIYARFVGF